MVAYWEIAAHSAYDMFSQYKYRSVNLVLIPPRFFKWGFLSDCAIFLIIAYFYFSIITDQINFFLMSF